jgi:hypothetical protein
MEPLDAYWKLTEAFPLGDQDVLNVLFSVRPEWLHALPPRFNHCLDLDTAGAMPCILHFCGNKLMPTAVGQKTLPPSHPWKAAYLFTRYWPLVSPTQPPLFTK